MCGRSPCRPPGEASRGHAALQANRTWIWRRQRRRLWLERKRASAPRGSFARRFNRRYPRSSSRTPATRNATLRMDRPTALRVVPAIGLRRVTFGEPKNESRTRVRGGDRGPLVARAAGGLPLCVSGRELDRISVGVSQPALAHTIAGPCCCCVQWDSRATMPLS
jgi:hypothetical protein